MQPALALRPWRAPSISAPACREGRSPAARLTCARQSARDRAAHTWPRRPRRRPKPRPSLRLQPSPRCTGPAVALDDGLRPDHVPPGCASEPRQATVNTPSRLLATPRRPRARPVDARIGPVRPRIAASAPRPASEPPSTRPHTPESAARRAPVARSARLRPVRAVLSRLSAAHQRSVRCDSALNPALGAPCRRLSGSPPAASSCSSAALRRPRQGPPAPPPRPPVQFPAGAGDARTHICPRVRRGNFQKENPSEGDRPAPPPRLPLSSLGRRARRGHRFPCLRG